MTKTCSRCGIDKPLEQYYKGNTALGVASWCIACYRENYRGERTKKYYLKHNFGITHEEYDQMVMAQCGTCALCGEPESATTRDGDTKALAVDHDHDTDEIRALLCLKCNLGISYLNDDPQLMERAATYVSQ